MTEHLNHLSTFLDLSPSVPSEVTFCNSFCHFQHQSFFHFLAFNSIFLFARPFKILCTVLRSPPPRKSSAFMLAIFLLSSLSPCSFSSFYSSVCITYALFPHFLICLSGFCTDGVVTCDHLLSSNETPFYFWMVAPTVQLETFVFVC